MSREEIRDPPLAAALKGIADWHCIVASNRSFGIVAALNAGADIVLCGRVADASPFIGLAAWNYGWTRDNFDALAGAFVAGHIGECVSTSCVSLVL